MGSVYSITETQQLLVETLTTEEVINGPASITFLNALKKGKLHIMIHFVRNQARCHFVE
jgi:hypothetical protein